jgi:hypothetical protein
VEQEQSLLREIQEAPTPRRRAIAALCMLPDGRLASGGWDNTIPLWT